MEWPEAYFLRVKLKAKLLSKKSSDLRKQLFKIGLSMREKQEVSRPGEPPPESLAEQSVNLSAHSAPIIQSLAERPSANEQTTVARDPQVALTNALPVVDGVSASYISALPTEPEFCPGGERSGTSQTCRSARSN